MSSDTSDFHRSDAELMARIAEGDQAAFKIFAQRHVARCLAVAQRILGNACDAEEIVQDGMLRLWQRAPDWRPGEALVTTWLYRIIVNLAIDRMRQRRHRFVGMDQLGDPADPAPNAHSLVESRQLETAVNAAIAALPERQRIALSLCGVEGLSAAEAAAVLQISVSALESLLVRARRTLRWQLSRLGLTEEMAGAQPAPLGRHIARFPLATLSFGTGALASAPA